MKTQDFLILLEQHQDKALVFEYATNQFVGANYHMSVFKALAILKKVGKMKPYNLDAELKVEYSNETFHTAQLFINDYDIYGQNLVIKLGVKKTDCKAKDVCSTKEIKETVNTNTEPCCSPDGNCC